MEECACPQCTIATLTPIEDNWVCSHTYPKVSILCVNGHKALTISPLIMFCSQLFPQLSQRCCKEQTRHKWVVCGQCALLSPISLTQTIKVQNKAKLLSGHSKPVLSQLLEGWHISKKKKIIKLVFLTVLVITNLWVPYQAARHCKDQLQRQKVAQNLLQH